MDNEDAIEYVRGLGPLKAEHFFRSWFERNFGDCCPIRLFDTETVEISGIEAEAVSTTEYGRDNRTVLKRSDDATAALRNEIRAAMIFHAYRSPMADPESWLKRKFKALPGELPSEVIEALIDGTDREATVALGDPLGVEKKIHLSPGDVLDADGILYVLHTYDESGGVVPRYIGITEMSYDNRHLNAVIDHNAESKMARWGYGRNQHMGELSCAMFPEEHSWEPSAKYQHWVDELFVKQTRLLDQPLYLQPAVWGGDIRLVERIQVMAASKAWPDEVLNTHYRSEPNHRLSEY